MYFKDYMLSLGAATDVLSGAVLPVLQNNTVQRLGLAFNAGPLQIPVVNASRVLQVLGSAKFQQGGITLLLGADAGATSLTDSTSKYFRIACPHYTNAEEPVAGMMIGNDGTTSTVFIGGGTGMCNAATVVSFHTAANNTTLTGTERMRILPTGEVLIAQTTSWNSAYKLQVNAAARIGYNSANTNTATGALWLQHNCTGDMADNFGASLVFGIRDDAAVDNNIAYISGRRSGADNSGSLYFTTYNGGSAQDRMKLSNNGRLNLGSSVTEATSGNNCGRIQLSADTSCGIFLGNALNTATNVLDWYEEGSFIPVVVGSTAAGSGTYATQNGKYTRIGNRVDFTLTLAWSAHSGTGNMRITGLPSAHVPSCASAMAFAVYYNALTVGTGKECVPIVLNGDTTIYMKTCDQAGAGSGDVAMDTSCSNLTISGTYFV